jgi:hypothetical protein
MLLNRGGWPSGSREVWLGKVGDSSTWTVEAPEAVDGRSMRIDGRESRHVVTTEVFLIFTA